MADVKIPEDLQEWHKTLSSCGCSVCKLPVVLIERIAALEVEVERLTAPVSDKEWRKECSWSSYGDRSQVNAIIAARAANPPKVAPGNMNGE